ncbi:MAG: helix-turn-helix domain-containing protein [Planctomycetota bacterium]
MAERWVSIDEISEHLGVKKDTIYKWVAKKKMPAHKVGRLLKFQIKEVDRWIREGKASPDYKGNVLKNSRKK